MKELLAVARGEKLADFVVKGARVANVFTLEYEEVDVAVFGDRIAGLGENYEGKSVIDGSGQVLIPGLIDGHVHIESTLLAPFVFADQVALHGTTAVMADPHEIANVLGVKGVEYMYLASRGLPVDVFLGAPSCVPASNFESAFDDLDMDDIRTMFDRGWCQHLGEVMNFPGVIAGNPELWGKIKAAVGAPLTGHAPSLSGKELCAYIASGISSDHESTDWEEAQEKLRRGMWLMMREGTSSPDLRRLLPLVKINPALSSRCMVVSDDVTAKALVQKGHMDEKIRIMIREGLDPLVALRMVTLSPASYFGLKDRGAIGPGRLADMVLVKNLEDCEPLTVWKSGIPVVKDGKLCRKSVSCVSYAEFRTNTPENLPIDPSLLAVFAPEGAEMNVIGVEEGYILTRKLTMKPLLRSGQVFPDVERDIAKVVVQERHRGSGRFSVGFVTGFGMSKGAIASSVAHDAHNFVVVGVDDLSIATALAYLAKYDGGLVVTSGSEVLGNFDLPVAGLMSTLNALVAAKALDTLEEKARLLGVRIAHPFMTLSFLCLSVIPELKITDRGYVDITKGESTPLFTIR